MDPVAVVAWVVPFLLVTYLGLRGGGYDALVRGEVAIVLWWAVLLAAVVGVLPRVGGLAWGMLGALVLLAAWSALGASGSESTERTLLEVARILCYAGVLVVALALGGAGATRFVLAGTATGMGVVIALALLSRLEPGAFPSNDQLAFLPAAARRLSYPLNYWNALASFVAVGVALLLAFAGAARRLHWQALAAAMVPVAVLCGFFCVSRGGSVALVIGACVYIALAADRLPKLLSMAVMGGGSALLVASALDKDEIRTGVDSAAARSQGRDLLVLCLLVAAGTAVAQTGIAAAARNPRRPAWTRPSRRVAAAVALVLVALGIAGGLVAGAPGEAADRWTAFKTPPAGETSAEDVFSRLQNTSGNGRFQFWQSAGDAQATDPWRGIGAGTFEFWWLRNGSLGVFIRDAHSWYVETFAELGWIGLALVVAFMVLALVGGLLGVARATDPAHRTLVAGVVAAVVVVLVGAAVDWLWEVAVIPVVLMLVLGAVAGALPGPLEPKRRTGVRIAVAALSLLALVAVAVPQGALREVAKSRAAASSGRLEAALGAARAAATIQPYSATAHLQEALVLERMGQADAAAAAATKATTDEPTNWRPWLVLARLEAVRSREVQALTAYRQARSLNPRSSILHP